MEQKTAAKHLRHWLDHEGRKGKWLARECEIKEQTVSGWLMEHHIPQAAHRIRIEALTGIPADAWDPTKGAE